MQFFLVALWACVSQLAQAGPVDTSRFNQSTIAKYVSSSFYTLHEIEDLRAALFDENMDLSKKYSRKGYFRGSAFILGVSEFIP